MTLEIYISRDKFHGLKTLKKHIILKTKFQGLIGEGNMNSQQPNVKNMKKLRFLGICGIIAPILFLLLVIVGSLLRPDYSQFQNFVSDLGVGSNSYIQNINFIIFGILSICLALGLRISIPSPQGISYKAGVWMVVLFGIGVLFAGVFPENYGSGDLHNITSASAFLFIIAAQLLIWRGLKSSDSSIWETYRKYCLISGLLSIILVIILKIAMLDYTMYQGLAQRAFLAIPWIWIGVTGYKLYLLSNEYNQE
jgi:hypothetical membrane protein